MLESALNFLKECGVWGLFGATAIEASSLPFPGALFVLLYGYLLDVSFGQIVVIGFFNSLFFTAFSLIPFYIGTKIETFTKKKLPTDKIEKAQKWFRKYGAWSIVFTRPLSIGNYVSYISGISGIQAWKFAVFTFIGAFPWNTFLLFVGNSGSLLDIEKVLEQIRSFGYIITALLVVVAVGYFLIWRKKQAKTIKADVDQEV